MGNQQLNNYVRLRSILFLLNCPLSTMQVVCAYYPWLVSNLAIRWERARLRRYSVRDSLLQAY